MYTAPAWRCTDCQAGFDYTPADANCPHHCGGVLVPTRDIDLEEDRSTRAGRIRAVLSDLDGADKFTTEDVVEAFDAEKDECAVADVPLVFVPLSTLKIWLAGYVRAWKTAKSQPSLHGSLSNEGWAGHLHDEMVTLGELEKPNE